jgi:hypothetical protein
LSRLKASTRRLFNKAKKTGDWESYKMALTKYHKAMRKAKLSSWRAYCWGIENVPDRACLMRIMANQSANKVGSIKLPNGHHTQAGIETLWEVYRVHFLGSAAGETTELRQGQLNLETFIAHREDWKLSKRVIHQSKIKWVINTFKPFKLAGIDEIVPALLHQGVDRLTTHLCRIFRACLAREYIPIAWRQVKVTFIPKPGKANHTETKAYRPISLMSFTLRTMETLVDRHIGYEILGLHPLHQYQFAYQPRKSTETALHQVIACIEEAVENRVVTLGAFLDIEGVSDNTSHSIIIEAAKRHGLEDTICGWISFIQGNRKIIATLAGDSGGVCGQGLSAGRGFVTPAVESGCEQTHRRTQ